MVWELEGFADRTSRSHGPFQILEHGNAQREERERVPATSEEGLSLSLVAVQRMRHTSYCVDTRHPDSIPLAHSAVRPIYHDGNDEHRPQDCDPS